MNAFKRVSTATLITVGIAAGTVGVAAAATVGGGTWNHGVTLTTSYSHYHHPSNCHGATAVGTRVVRVSAPAGQWAKANAPRALGNNQAYWRNSC